MKGYTLIQAILMIQNQESEQITMIQYEDGSRYKFNYLLHHEGTPKFIDLTPEETYYYVNPDGTKSINTGVRIDTDTATLVFKLKRVLDTFEGKSINETWSLIPSSEVPEHLMAKKIIRKM